VLTLAPRGAGVAAGIERPLPAGWTVSFDLRLARGARATLDLGGAGALKLRSLRGVLFAGRATRLHRTPERGGWYRVEAATKYGGAQLDGQPVRTMRRAGARPVVQVERGSLAVRAP